MDISYIKLIYAFIATLINLTYSMVVFLQLTTRVKPHPKVIYISLLSEIISQNIRTTRILANNAVS